MADADTDVVITKPGYPTVVIGPMSERDAEGFVAGLHREMQHTAHPEGTTVNAAPHSAACEHDPFNVVSYRDPEAVAAMTTGEPGFGIDFPDTYTRLTALPQVWDADEMWDRALGILMARDADKEREEVIARLTASIPELLANAANLTGIVSGQLDELCSDRVFDDEMLGGPADDMRAELDAAGRHLRNAQRIANIRRALWAREG